MSTTRQFSRTMRSSNLRFVPRTDLHSGQILVGLILLEYFSLPAYTQLLDTLVTANLIQDKAFASETYSLDDEAVMSDLGLQICPNQPFDLERIKSLDLLVVCGGLRTVLHVDNRLLRAMQVADAADVALGGLWNGAWFLAQAGLLDEHRCAIHPENRPALAEVARQAVVTSDSFVVDRQRLTAASPAGAFQMALEWIRQLKGPELADGVSNILAFEEERYRRASCTVHEKLSEPLRNVVQLMTANIEEPLSLEQIASYVQRSRRQIERLFHEQLNTSPRQYYLELRITEARRLLQHSDLPILDVSTACGFVSSSHFSKCYTAFFGYPPSKEIRRGNVRTRSQA